MCIKAILTTKIIPFLNLCNFALYCLIAVYLLLNKNYKTSFFINKFVYLYRTRK